MPLLRLAWNKQDPNYLATITMDSNKVRRVGVGRVVGGARRSPWLQRDHRVRSVRSTRLASPPSRLRRRCTPAASLPPARRASPHSAHPPPDAHRWSSSTSGCPRCRRPSSKGTRSASTRSLGRRTPRATSALRATTTRCRASPFGLWAPAFASPRSGNATPCTRSLCALTQRCALPCHRRSSGTCRTCRNRSKTPSSPTTPSRRCLARRPFAHACYRLHSAGPPASSHLRPHLLPPLAAALHPSSDAPFARRCRAGEPAAVVQDSAGLGRDLLRQEAAGAAGLSDGQRAGGGARCLAWLGRDGRPRARQALATWGAGREGVA